MMAWKMWKTTAATDTNSLYGNMDVRSVESQGSVRRLLDFRNYNSSPYVG